MEMVRFIGGNSKGPAVVRRTFEHRVGGVVADELLRLRVPLEPGLQPRSDVRDHAHVGCGECGIHVRDRVFPRAHTLDDVALVMVRFVERFILGLEFDFKIRDGAPSMLGRSA